MEKIKFIGIEDKPTQSGKARWVVSSSIGSLNCWSQDIAERLKKLSSGELIEVETSEKDGYINLRQFLPTSQDGVVVTTEKIAGIPRAAFDSTSMYVSYAKDLFVAIYPEAAKTMPMSEIGLMGVCVDLIKHAKARWEN